MDKAKGAKEGGEEKKRRCFVITPIGAAGSTERQHADWVLNQAVKPVFEPRGYEVFRSDTIADPAMINDAIFNHITDDDVCIADLSFLNPNVFYELGVRHALLKPVIHIAHDAIRLPFDTAQHRAIFFTLADFYSMESLKKQMGEQLDAIEADGFKISNPLTHAKGRQELAKSGDSKDRLISDLLSRVESLESQRAVVLSPTLRRTRNAWRLAGVQRSFTHPEFSSDADINSLSLEILDFLHTSNDIPRHGLKAEFLRIFSDRIYELDAQQRQLLKDYIANPASNDSAELVLRSIIDELFMGVALRI